MSDMGGNFTPQSPGSPPVLKLVALIDGHGVEWDITPKPGERHLISIDTATLEDGSLYVNQVSIRVEPA